MATGIGQQIKGMVDRARHYWAELTDEKDSRQHAQDQRNEAVHQRYGGVRERDERVDTNLHGRPADLADRVPPEAPPLSHSARSGQAPQMGEQSGRDTQMQGSSQTQRQYTQQGGSGIQKTLDEQLEESGRRASAASQQRRRPGPQNQ